MLFTDFLFPKCKGKTTEKGSDRGRSTERRRKNEEERSQLPTSETFADATCCPHVLSFIYAANTPGAGPSSVAPGKQQRDM